MSEDSTKIYELKNVGLGVKMTTMYERIDRGV